MLSKGAQNVHGLSASAHYAFRLEVDGFPGGKNDIDMFGEDVGLYVHEDWMEVPVGCFYRVGAVVFEEVCNIGQGGSVGGVHCLF